MRLSCGYGQRIIATSEDRKGITSANGSVVSNGLIHQVHLFDTDNQYRVSLGNGGSSIGVFGPTNCTAYRIRWHSRRSRDHCRGWNSSRHRNDEQANAGITCRACHSSERSAELRRHFSRGNYKRIETSAEPDKDHPHLASRRDRQFKCKCSKKDITRCVTRRVQKFA